MDHQKMIIVGNGTKDEEVKPPKARLPMLASHLASVEPRTRLPFSRSGSLANSPRGVRW